MSADGVNGVNGLLYKPHNISDCISIKKGLQIEEFSLLSDFRASQPHDLAPRAERLNGFGQLLRG